MDNSDHRPSVIDNSDGDHHHDHSADMAAVVAAQSSAPQPSNPTSRDAAVAKRYRAAPAKTFQCRGYGDCRMVFSRSEHLARHVRKHTGERPFTCHCSKQFSRLDNLRQHAQTVHSDKQEQNDAMMRELTALHTTMTAANKGGASRGKRAPPTHVPSHPPATAGAAAVVASSVPLAPGGASGHSGQVKVEELQMHRTLSQTNYNAGPHGTRWTPLNDATSRLSSPTSSTSSFEEYILNQHQLLPPTPPITPPTAIPFVTPPSPFEPHHTTTSSPSSSSISSISSHPLAPAHHPHPHHPHQHLASPFSPPSPFSPVPANSFMADRHHLAQAQAAAGLPLQADPTLYAQSSRHSLPLSPNPSPHPASGLTYFPFPPQQDQAHDRAPPLDPEQLQQHISPTGLLSAAPEDFPSWGLSQNYPFTPLDTAGTSATTSSSLQSWEEHTPMHPHHHAAAENTSRTSHPPHPTDRGATTARFPSTLPRHRSPHRIQQQQHHQGSAASARSEATGTAGTSTMSNGVGANTPRAATVGMRAGAASVGPGPHPPRAPQQANAATPTGASPALSLDGSQSWSSAMTPSLAQQLFFQYPPQDQQQPLDGSHQGQSQQQQQGYYQAPLLQQQHQGLRSMQAHQHEQSEGQAQAPLSAEYLQQQYAALHRAQGGSPAPGAGAPQVGYYLSGAGHGLPPPPAYAASVDEARSQGAQQQPHTPTSSAALQTPASAFSSPPAMIKFESPSLHARTLQLLPE